LPLGATYIIDGDAVIRDAFADVDPSQTPLNAPLSPTDIASAAMMRCRPT